MSELREKTYSTAEVMKTFDLGRNALRLYEEMGLLTGLARTEAGYREFKSRHMADLKFVIEAKSAGFTLNEIKELLEIVRTQNKMTCGTIASEVTQKVGQISEEIKALEAKKLFLADFLQTCGSQSTEAECDVMAVGFSKGACCN